MSGRSTRSNRTNKAVVSFDNSPESSQVSSTSSKGGRGRGKKKNEPTIPEETSSGGPGGEPVEEQELTLEQETVISTICRYVLLHEHAKTLLKSIDITKYLQENHLVAKTKDVPFLLSKCIKRLDSVFGLQLVEHTETGGKCFILHSKFSLHEILMDEAEEVEEKYSISNGVVPVREIDDDDDQTNGMDHSSDMSSLLSDDEGDHTRREMSLDLNDDDHQELEDTLTLDAINAGSKRGLLLITLAAIFMNDDPLPEVDLFAMYRTLGLNLDAKIETGHESHTTTMKKILNEDLIRRAYLRRVKVRAQEPGAPVTYVYEWGPRSVIEFKKCDILHFVKNIYQVDDVTVWHTHEKRALACDEERRKRINRVASGSVPPPKPSTTTTTTSTSNNNTNGVNGHRGTDGSEDGEEDIQVLQNGNDVSVSRSSQRTTTPARRGRRKRKNNSQPSPVSSAGEENGGEVEEVTVMEEEEEPRPKRRGRPPKNASSQVAPTPTTTKKSRGRPPGSGRKR